MQVTAGPLDNLDTPDAMREAERQTVLANAVVLSVSDDIFGVFRSTFRPLRDEYRFVTPSLAKRRMRWPRSAGRRKVGIPRRRVPF
jgi:hypothetical protein